jgi:hypothetical protein
MDADATVKEKKKLFTTIALITNVNDLAVAYV